METWNELPEHLKNRVVKFEGERTILSGISESIAGEWISEKTPQQRTHALGRLHAVEYETVIGIDPGTHTGVAEKINGKFTLIQTMTIIEAIEFVKGVVENQKPYCLVRIEDARQRQWFGKSGPEKWKGAGSIIRDCRIWEDEMDRQGITVEWVHPKNVKATTAEQFKKMTGWEGRTSIHAREAAWLIL